MYQPGDASQILNIPSSTLRYYARTFSAHLSQSAQGRRRVYTDLDLETLHRIRELSDLGETTNQILAALGETVVVDEVEDTPNPGKGLALLPGALFQMNDDLTEIKENQAALLSEMELLRQELKEARRPFWERIFKRGK